MFVVDDRPMDVCLGDERDAMSLRFFVGPHAFIAAVGFCTFACVASGLGSEIAFAGPPSKAPSTTAARKQKTPAPPTAAERSAQVMNQATNAITSVRATRYRAAVDALERALFEARALDSLDVTKVIVVADKPEALGVYRPSDGGRIADRHLRLYVEVENFGHAPLQTDAGTEDLYEVNLDVTGIFFLENGEELGQKSLGTHRYETRSPLGVTWLGLDVQLGDSVPNGTYAIQIEVHDRVREKKSSRRIAFKIP